MVTNNLEAYRALKAEAKRSGMPQSHREDVTQIDRSILSKKDAPRAFAWATRETGTDLFPPDYIGAYNWALAQQSSGRHFYWYDGEQLREVGFQSMINHLAASFDLDRLNREIDTRFVTLYTKQNAARVSGAWFDQRAAAEAKTLWQTAIKHLREIEAAQELLDPDFIAEVRAQVTGTPVQPVQQPVEAVTAVTAEDAETEQDRCRTPGCDGDPNTGDSWDGYCGDCADRLAPAEA